MHRGIALFDDHAFVSLQPGSHFMLQSLRDLCIQLAIVSDKRQHVSLIRLTYGKYFLLIRNNGKLNDSYAAAFSID